MFDRFDEQAIRVMHGGKDEAQKLDNPYFGTEHVLLGITRERDGVAIDALAHLGVETAAIRRELEALCKRGPSEGEYPRQIPFTPRAKRSLELAFEEATKLGHNHIGAEHLLIGLLAEKEGLAANVLMRLGLELEPLRAEIRRQLGIRREDQGLA